MQIILDELKPVPDHYIVEMLPLYDDQKRMEQSEILSMGVKISAIRGKIVKAGEKKYSKVKEVFPPGTVVYLTQRDSSAFTLDGHQFVFLPFENLKAVEVESK